MEGTEPTSFFQSFLPKVLDLGDVVQRRAAWPPDLGAPLAKAGRTSRRGPRLPRGYHRGFFFALNGVSARRLTPSGPQRSHSRFWLQRPRLKLWPRAQWTAR
ncbi:hypothetical protein NDU88_005865 [Pleurodeles waltl]|uniref:Uncharacterized protein n=1 Tax=Pleurodeles waltl TaxID=8319 RepID=A0AAV7NNP2_PLEWA|nr:hypothetical protein NDU88_005865 [Pleurodeles waltl]